MSILRNHQQIKHNNDNYLYELYGMSKHQNVIRIMNSFIDEWSLNMTIFLFLPRGHVKQKLVLLSFGNKLIWFDLASDCRITCEG